MASSVFDSSGKILAYRALGDDRFQNGEDLNGILEGSSSGAMGANLSVEGLLAVGVMLVFAVSRGRTSVWAKTHGLE